MEQTINSSSLHKAVTDFFCQNPAAIDTVSGVAAWIRAEKKAVNKVLKDLVKVGVLDSHQVSSTIAYSYTRDPELIAQIKQVLS